MANGFFCVLTLKKAAMIKKESKIVIADPSKYKFKGTGKS